MKGFPFLKIIILFFTILSGILILIHLVNLTLFYLQKLSIHSWYFQLFDLNRENNIPAVFSSIELLTASIILLVIALRERNLRSLNWLLLSIIFLFLSMDEFFSIHERLNSLRNTFQVSGYLYFAWVIPYGIAVIFLAIVFYKFLVSLPVKTKRLIVLSGIIYISGALGFELISSRQFVNDNELRSLTYRIITFFEESLEMCGIVLFIYALLHYLKIPVNTVNH